MALLVAACTPTEVGEEPEQPLASQPGTPPTDATTTATGFPKEVTVMWDCNEVEGRDFEDLTFNCLTGSHPEVIEFHEGYFTGSVNFRLNGRNERIAISMSAGGYNGSCTWSPDLGVTYDAPIEDGSAVIEGVLFGTDVCEGLQFTFDATWDEETLGIAMHGVLDQIG